MARDLSYLYVVPKSIPIQCPLILLPFAGVVSAVLPPRIRSIRFLLLILSSWETGFNHRKEEPRKVAEVATQLNKRVMITSDLIVLNNRGLMLLK